MSQQAVEVNTGSHSTIVNASAAGSGQLQASNSGGSGTVTIKANSDLVARKTG